MRLLIIRHGETVENREGVITGQKPGRLTARGKAHAEALARQLSKVDIAIILSSDLKRCRDTVAIIRRRVKAPVAYRKELREISSGIFDGKTMPYLRAAMAASKSSRIRFKPKHGESLLEFRRRVRTAIGLLRADDKLRGASVLICSHTAWTREFLRVVRKPKLFDRSIIFVELR
ncbi:MAG: histidine phosphatase family protein [Candidatus Yanofskybacteria bacterium]|nr:histidine phosphatase family protein [Candidatus Yanofskybacteria bacterium]